MALVGLTLAGGATAVRGQSALDGFDPNANGTVRVVVVQPDGKILLGGDFTTLSPNGGGAVTRNNIARLNPDGTLDTAFNPNANATVNSIAVQADGKILAGGLFTSIGGQMRNRIARLDATTGLADSFDPNANNAVRSIVVQADGKILAGGFFFGANSIGGQTRNRIARLDATTGLADSFDPNANDDVVSIAVQADGKILIGGGFFNVFGVARNKIARLNTDGTLDTVFNPNANGFVNSIAVQADGKILAGGFFNGATSIGGQTRNYIARLDATTGLADSFDPNANNVVYSIAVQADGKILAGGAFTSIGGQMRNRLARLDATTGLADSFNPNANDLVLSIAVQADGKILAGGGFNGATSIGGQTRNFIARLETDGRLDQTLNLSIVGSYVTATAVQPDGKILIGGVFTTVLGVARNNIARLNTDGTLDIAFDPNANNVVYSIAVQADGKILAGGAFTSIGGQTRNRVARLDATTGLADSFDPNANNFVYSIAVQADGKILAGGQFTGANSIGGQTRNYIARLDATTGLADSFDPNANFTVFSIAVQADGKILAGGGFTSIGGQTRNNIARLDATTGLADSFDPNANSSILSIAVQADGKILAGGMFTSIGGQTRHRIARLDATTGLADSFDPNATNLVYSIAVQADGKILAGGVFNGATSIGGQTRNFIARLDATTGLADSFDPNANGIVNSIAVQADGKILAGGFFTSIGGQTRNYFARLSNDTAALQNLAVTQTTITWTRGGSSAQFTRVTFEYSTDNVNYTPLGNGTATGSNWTLTGLNLPTGVNIYIRARGYYRSGYQNGSESITESVRNAFELQALLGNISTRAFVQTGNNVMIGGFIITGNGPIRVIVRAIGPSLVNHGITNPLQNPTLELHNHTGAVIAFNDNWMSAPNKQEIINSGLAPTNNLESAILMSLSPGNYTAIVRGVNNGTGIALVEAYDLDPTAGSKLGNISTRALVQTGNNVMIGGFIITGSGQKRVIVRAIGPSLVKHGITNPLQNPTLELHDHTGAVIAFNDNWMNAPNKQEIINSGLAPTNNFESAILTSLSPGNYTAIVRGVNNGTGIALVEVYGLN
jgi:uncharacterized delta-60 repeat protein